MTCQRAGNSKDKLAVSQRNKKYYERTKASQDQIVMRLHKGERIAIDAAAEAAGLTRTAFFQLYLAPISAALTGQRLRELNRLVSLRKISLTTVIGRLIDDALGAEEGPVHLTADAQQEVAQAFDHLFNSAPVVCELGEGPTKR